MTQSRIQWLITAGLTLLSPVSLVGAQNADGRIPYEVAFEGVPSRALLGTFQQQSQTWRHRSRPPASLRQLRQRAQADVPRLERVLQSNGYYEGQVDVDIKETNTTVNVVFNITPGPLYTIASWAIEWMTTDPNIPALIQSGVALQGKTAEATHILATETQILNQLNNQGYPLGQVLDRSVVLDPNDHQIEVVSQIETGPRAKFGPVTISGLKGVQESYIKQRIPWRQERFFSQAKIKRLEKNLLQSGLFAAVRVQPALVLDPNECLPIHIDLSERKHRTVRLGGSYVTDEQGLGAQVSWEHRNLGGQGRRLRGELSTTQIDVTQRTSYLHPDIWRPDLDLLLDLELAKEYPEAYSSQRVRMAATLQYQVRPWQTDVWGGIAQTVTTVEEQDVRTRYNFLEFPLGLDWDRRNDPLNATQGWQVLLHTTPQTAVNKGINFFKNYGEVRVFQPLSWVPNSVLAARAGAGAITGVALENVPLDRRFYCGGAGSVRGYAYQSIGPANDGKPSGGLSMIETSVELRSSWSDRWGTVVFLDGGTVFAEVFDYKDEEPMRWAAGLGLRYFLDFAPLRFDVAFPLNREKDDDREFQFYVSIGQAF
jgi:translocation and assembly module TamA